MSAGLLPFAPVLVWGCWSLVRWRSRRRFLREARREVEELTKAL